MNSLGQFLDDRADAGATQQKDLERQNSAEPWMLTRAPEGERLLGFDRWLRRRLETRLDWAWAGGQKARRIEQCRLRLEGMVLGLWRRGWLLDGKRLATHVDGLLAAVAAYQRKGAILDFWAYFNAACERYVGQNAEEIQAEAMSAGVHVSGALAKLLQGAGRAQERAMPELLAERAGEVAKAKEEGLRKKVARARAREKTDQQQGRFL